MRSQLLGEFMGTLVLILLGDGVVAGVLLKDSKAEGAGWLAITTAWAFAVMVGAFTAVLFGSPDAHLNPALTLAFAVEHRDFHMVLPYWAAQISGGLCGAVLVWLLYWPHWARTEDPATKLGVFCTSPAVRLWPANLFAEALATCVLVLAAGALGSKLVLSAGPAPGLSPFLVGVVVWGIGLSLGGPTGYAINPARDLAPRLAHALLPIAGKGGSDWRYSWIPVLGPLLGGAIAGAILLCLKA